MLTGSYQLLRKQSYIILACLLFISSFQAASAALGDIERVSVSSSGQEGNNLSYGSSMSGDGRFVAFVSFASNLVSGDNNGVRDIFVYDRLEMTTTRVSIASSGVEANDLSLDPSISTDGRFVAFESWASNLVNGDTNGEPDIFVHDRQEMTTTRVSVDSSGAEANHSSDFPSISADGRFVAFESYASNLVSGDTNNVDDIFVHDRQERTTTRISVDSSGAEANHDSNNPSISADGRFIAFVSKASNLVGDDTNGREDIFVHDRQERTTTRVSVDSSGAEANSLSINPSISANGHFVAFESQANNLVNGDSNFKEDIFVHELATGTTTRVSVNNSGVEGNISSINPSISANGRFVAFNSGSNNLVSNDSNEYGDIFVHDRHTGTTTRVSVGDSGAEGNESSWDPSLSGDGRFVAFTSRASNFVSGDSNNALDIFVTKLPVPPASCDLDSGANIIHGTPGKDRLKGTSGNDIIFGYGGDDRIEGLGGNDCLVGGDGGDDLIGGEGDDILWGGEIDNSTVYERRDRDRLYGEAGNDELHGGGDHDHLEGDEGDDRLWGDDGNDGMHGDDGNDEMHGGNGKDRMEGRDGDDQMWGDAGDDTIIGRDGNDYLDGGDDKDRLEGGDGSDEMHGGAGNDRMNGDDGNDIMYGDGGDDSMQGRDGEDVMYGGSGNDDMNGGRDNDMMYGNADNDRMDGDRGDDIMQGNGGNDIVDGRDGNDQLEGNDGDDELKGGKGDDLLDGGDDYDRLDGHRGTDTCLNGESLKACEL
ncbi:MAG: hypothetical protein AAF614_26785 [Chloroflexota bacterium]